MKLSITVSAPGSFDPARDRIMGGGVKLARKLARAAADDARPHVPRRTGRLASTVADDKAKDGAKVHAGRRHPGMANNAVRDRTRAALNKAARAALNRREF